MTKRISIYSICIIIGVCLVFDAHNRWKGDWWKGTINADGYGYYAYLPCIFIYHGFDYHRIVQEERKARPEISEYEASYLFPVADNGKPSNRCFVGESVLLAPFFLLAYFLSYLLGYDLNGYSLLFQLSVSIAALFYLVAGLLFVRKLLKEYSFSEGVIAITLLLLTLGTNLLYYATIQPSLSHVYSFCAIAAFLCHAKKTINSFNRQDAIFMALSFGFVILLRPVALLSLTLIPFLAGDFKTLQSFLLKVFTPKVLLSLLLCVFAVISVQFIVWKLQTGHFFYWSYKGEHFYFNDPHFFGTLFSYRCGWFLYTPVMFVAVIGGLTIELRKSLFRFFSFIFFFGLLTYVLSSWYSWFYGGFGLRTFIDYYSAFAILLALVLHTFSTGWKRIAISVLLFALVFVNITQTRQFTNFIIDYRYMDKERYWKVFMKTGSQYVGLFAEHPPANIKFYDAYRYKSDFENNSWGNDSSITDKNSMITRHSAYIGSKISQSPTLTLRAVQLPNAPKLNIYITLWAYMDDTNNDAQLVVSLQTKKDSVYFSSTLPIKNQVQYTSTWQEIKSLMELPPFRNSDDILKVYERATTGTTYIDDVNVCFGLQK